MLWLGEKPGTHIRRLRRTMEAAATARLSPVVFMGSGLAAAQRPGMTASPHIVAPARISL